MHRNIHDHTESIRFKEFTGKRCFMFWKDKKKIISHQRKWEYWVRGVFWWGGGGRSLWENPQTPSHDLVGAQAQGVLWSHRTKTLVLCRCGVSGRLWWATADQRADGDAVVSRTSLIALAAGLIQVLLLLDVWVFTDVTFMTGMEGICYKTTLSHLFARSLQPQHFHVGKIRHLHDF